MKINSFEQIPGDDGKKEKMQCQVCKGSGKVNGKNCKVCGGTGKTP